MQPDIDLQLATVIKSLRDVVTPALEPGNPMAAEQLRVCIATLALVRDRQAQVLPRVRRELADAVELADAADALLGDDDRFPLSGEAGRRLLADPLADQHGMDRERLRLMETVSERARLMPDTPLRAEFFRLLLTCGKRQFDLNRAWLVQAGREPDPAAVPALETLL